MPFLPTQSPESPYGSPAPFYPQHVVPSAPKPRPKVDKTKAHDKARQEARTARSASYAYCAADAPHCSAALARASGAVRGCDYGPGIMAELAAMPEGLALAISTWAAARCRRVWIDGNGMRKSAPATAASDLPSALPRVVWHLATSPRQAPKPLSGTHGKARRRSNWTAEGHVIRLDVLLRGALSNLRRQDSRNGGEAFKAETDPTTAIQTAAIQSAREAEARDRRKVAEHRISLREQRLALLGACSPLMLPRLLEACASGEAKDITIRDLLSTVRARAKELAMP